MSKFDRYLLSQLLALFGFFSLVLVAVYWVNRAVGLFDQLISDGQSALVFVEFSLLVLPNVIRLVLPISAFAACLYAINRLMQESELVVMQATGFSSFRLARPVLYFGICVCLMQLVLTNVLVPMSQTRLAARSSEVADNLSARFLNAGKFVHPSAGVTIYVRSISDLGELEDFFLSDERDPRENTVYTARQGLITRTDAGEPRLVMLDGMAQSLSKDGQKRLGLTRFADFTLDLSSIRKEGGARVLGRSEIATFELLEASPETQDLTRSNRAQLLEEGHSRLSGPLLGLAAPLLGFAALMIGSFSRFGAWKQMVFGVMLIILVQTINTWGSGQAVKTETSWPLVYFAPLLGIVIALALLWYSQRPKRVKSGQGVIA